MMEGSIQEDVTAVTAPNIGAPQHTRQTRTAIKEELDSDTVRVRGFSGQTPRQKINRETQALNDTKDQMDFTDIYRAFHPQTAEYTLFSVVPGTFSRIDHMVGHKASLTKLEKI